jgi:hypothetical protein
MGGIMLPYFGSTAGRQSQPDPNQLPSLNLWYNASASTTNINGVSTNNFSTAVVNGDPIVAWDDLSGTGHPANRSGGSTFCTYVIPWLNGLGAVRFDPANLSNLDINPIGWSQNLSGFTIYVLAKANDYSALFPLAVNDTNLGIKFDGTYMAAGAAGGIGQAQGWALDTSAVHVFGMIFDGTQTGNDNRLNFRIDGVDQSLNFGATTVGTVTNSLSTYFYVGGENKAGITLGFMNGYIGEVMMWTRALNLSEQLGVESYLSNKWGI